MRNTASTVTATPCSSCDSPAAPSPVGHGQMQLRHHPVAEPRCVGEPLLGRSQHGSCWRWTAKRTPSRATSGDRARGYCEDHQTMRTAQGVDAEVHTLVHRPSSRSNFALRAVRSTALRSTHLRACCQGRPYEPSTPANSVAELSKLSAVAFDIDNTDPMQASTINANSTAYSTAVGPSSRYRNSRIFFNMTAPGEEYRKTPYHGHQKSRDRCRFLQAPAGLLKSMSRPPGGAPKFVGCRCRQRRD